MWRKELSKGKVITAKNQTNDFNVLLHYITHLAEHKLGYPVSLLTYLGVVDNKVLGIMPDSLANILLNNVGDPFKDSETSLMEVKRHERELIIMLEKYYGLKKDEARGYVTTGGTEGNFAGLWWSKRYLINRALPNLIKTDDEIKSQIKEEQNLNFQLAKIPLNHYAERANYLQKLLDLKNAIAENKNMVQQLLTATVFYAKGHTHYSIPKIAEILKLNIRNVEPNEDGSMNLNNFKKELLLHKGAHPHSSVIVIANIGTTITGAIDDVPQIKKILDDTHLAANYTIHLDGALTGFVMPILKPFGEIQDYFSSLGVNTLAVSAHKYPGLSQPCGILLAQRSFFEKAFEKSERSIDYVGNILDVTITGSRSGLNVLMFYNALKTLELDKNSERLKIMVAENLENARYLYDKLVELYGKENVYYPYHFNVIFPKPATAITKQYQLMITGNRATICVLTNVTKELINQFINDLRADKEIAMENTDFTIKTLSSEHAKGTVDLFSRCFCDSEPITKHVGITYAEYVPFANEVVQKAIKDGMSKVLVDKQDRVLACCIAEDLAEPFVPKLSHYPKMQPILDLLNYLSKPFLEHKVFNRGKVAHIWIAAVDPEVRGLKISTKVDMACADMLARKGYDFAYAEFTNELSERVVHQYNLYQLQNKIPYAEFTTQSGERPFKDLKGSASSYIIVIRPGIKLEALKRYYKEEEKYHY